MVLSPYLYNDIQFRLVTVLLGIAIIQQRCRNTQNKPVSISSTLSTRLRLLFTLDVHPVVSVWQLSAEVLAAAYITRNPHQHNAFYISVDSDNAHGFITYFSIMYIVRDL